MQKRIQEQRPLETRIEDLEQINDKMLDEKLALRQKLSQIQSELRSFCREKHQIETLSTCNLTPRASNLRRKKAGFKGQKALKKKLMRLIASGTQVSNSSVSHNDSVISNQGVRVGKGDFKNGDQSKSGFGGNSVDMGDQISSFGNELGFGDSMFHDISERNNSYF